jgi:hypothetical protein
MMASPDYMGLKLGFQTEVNSFTEQLEIAKLTL